MTDFKAPAYLSAIHSFEEWFINLKFENGARACMVKDLHPARAAGAL